MKNFKISSQILFYIGLFIKNNTNFFSQVIYGVFASLLAAYFYYLIQKKLAIKSIKKDFRCEECLSDIITYLKVLYIPFFISYNSLSIDKKDFYFYNKDKTEISNHYKRQKVIINFYKKEIDEMERIIDNLTYENFEILYNNCYNIGHTTYNHKLIECINHLKNRQRNLLEYKSKDFVSLKTNLKKSKILNEEIDKICDKLYKIIIDTRFMILYMIKLLETLKYKPDFLPREETSNIKKIISDPNNFINIDNIQVKTYYKELKKIKLKRVFSTKDYYYYEKSIISKFNEYKA